MPMVTRFAKSTPSIASRNPWTKCWRDCSPSVTMSMPAVSCSRSATNTASRLPSASAGPDRLHGAHNTPGFASHAGLGRLPAIVVRSTSRFEQASGEERRRGPAEHGGAPHFFVEQRHDGPHSVVELLADRLHVVVLHLHAVQDELGNIRAEGLAIQHHVDDHAPDRDPKLVE